MKPSTKRIILRVVHLVAVIPGLPSDSGKLAAWISASHVEKAAKKTVVPTP